MIPDQLKKLLSGLTRTEQVSGIANPYKQFTYTIADGAIETLFYDFNYFRILSINTTTGVSIRFGSSGTPTDVVGAGVGYEMPSVVSRAEIINKSGGILTITVAAAIGRIDDDRLNISGSLSVAVSSIFDEIADVTIATSTKVTVANIDANRKTIIIQNLDAINSVRLGSTSLASTGGGILLKAGDSITLDTTGEVFAWQTSGASVSLSVSTLEA